MFELKNILLIFSALLVFIFLIRHLIKRSLSLAPPLKINFCSFIALLFALPALTSNAKETIPDFKSLQGDWTYSVSWLSEAYGDNKEGKIKVNLINNYELKGEEECQAISFNIIKEKLLFSVVQCTDKHFFVCNGYIHNCGLPVNVDYGDGKYTDIATLSGNTLTMHFEYIETRFVVEFTSDNIIYRYQEKDCFIPYPHGCLINSFSWHDIGQYELNKVRENNIKEHY